MSKAIDFFDGILKEAITGVHTSLSCQIVSFYGDSADVQPLPKIKLIDGKEIAYPMLSKVPVLKRKYQETVDGITVNKIETPYYEKGDTVLVVFSNRDLSAGTIIGLLG